MWFLKPDGWTVFDSFASNGLGIDGSDPIKRMEDFYKRLNVRNFGVHAIAINESLSSTDFSELHGERIIDKFLMLAGAPKGWKEGVAENCRAFLECLHPTVRKKLVEAANRISAAHGDNLLDLTTVPQG